MALSVVSAESAANNTAPSTATPWPTAIERMTGDEIKVRDGQRIGERP
jgi:hypothetical protein